MKKALQHIIFADAAARANALYNEEEDALLLAMLGQEYVIRHDGIELRGQRAPETHEAVLLDYLFSPGGEFLMTPWRGIGDFTDRPPADFRKRVEQPIAQHAADFVNRAGRIMPLFDADRTPSIIGSDFALTVRALPKVWLHLELSRETNEFPADAWVLFSNNAGEFLTVPSLDLIAELFKERYLSLLRIY